MTSTTADHDNLRALRRIQKLSLHLLQPLPSPDSQSYDDDIRIIPSHCACGHGRPPLSVSLTELAKYMKGRHREIQDRIINFLASRLELQTPVEISTADHRELCMQQLTALVREAGIRPLRYVIEDPSVYFAILEAAGSIDISLGIKLAGQYRLLLISIFKANDLRSFTFLALCNHFGILHNGHDIFQTFEGANAVLLQQVAGELLNKSKFCGGTLTETWNYLRESMASHISQPNPVTTRWQSEDHLRDPNFQLDAFRVSLHSSCYRIILCIQVRGIARELVDAFSLPEIIIRAPIGMASEAYSQHTEYVSLGKHILEEAILNEIFLTYYYVYIYWQTLL